MWSGVQIILSGTISFDFVPDSCVVGTEWYLSAKRAAPPASGVKCPLGRRPNGHFCR